MATIARRTTGHDQPAGPGSDPARHAPGYQVARLSSTAYAIKQVRDGRRVGAKLNVLDISSEYAQRLKQITVERLDLYDEQKGEWREVLIEDRHAGPAETAAARIDIGEWFDSLPKHKRRIAKTLATGETTKRTAACRPECSARS
ncbi:MAG: hypothetical protein NTY19_39280 [Planctomycetota bacterium]|nr:hypothetical protein [Planctomycetota bacterium]